MKYIIFSDIHNNYFALKEFYEYLLRMRCKFKLYFLGDMIGYYKFDVRTVRLLKTMINKWNMNMCIGNHDAAFFNHLGFTQFKIKHSKSLEETIKFNDKYKNKIIELFSNIALSEINITIDDEQYVLSHGGISDIINDYFYPDMNFIKLYEHKFTPNVNYICGHTHRPFIKKTKNNIFINVGSLGMPRDGDPRMCFLEIENNEFSIIRKFYNIDLLYNYNYTIKNNLKNRIYMGGNSLYINVDLLNFYKEKIHIKQFFNECICFDRAIYIMHNNCIFQILKINKNKIRYLLRFFSQEILFDSIEDIARRIKYENV